MALRTVVKKIPGAKHARRSVVRSRQTLEGLRDAQALARRLPELSVRHHDWITEPHRRYVSEVSSAAMAASAEMCHFLASAVESLRPRTVLDLGSGFSSFVLRCSDAEVWSVDDHAEWLGKTREFLEDFGVSTERVVHLDDFDWSQRFDLVFHDIGGIPVRKALLPRAIASTVPGGFLVLDDVQMLDYRKVIDRTVAVPHFSLHRFTKDRYNRFGMAVLP